MTHNPTVEQFPVMPVDITTISLKPCDFFTRNPALDVPQSTQVENRSVLVDNPLPQQETKVGGNDSAACCDSAKPKL